MTAARDLNEESKIKTNHFIYPSAMTKAAVDTFQRHADKTPVFADETLTLETLPKAIIEEMQFVETKPELTWIEKKAAVVTRIHNKWKQTHGNEELIEAFDQLVGALCDAFVSLDKHRVRIQKKASKLKTFLCGLCG